MLHGHAKNKRQLDKQHFLKSANKRSFANTSQSRALRLILKVRTGYAGLYFVELDAGPVMSRPSGGRLMMRRGGTVCVLNVPRRRWNMFLTPGWWLLTVWLTGERGSSRVKPGFDAGCDG